LHKVGALKTEILQVRRQGYAIVSQDLELGLCSIAVPIRAGNGRVCRRTQHQPALQATAARELAMKKMLPALRRCQQTIETGDRAQRLVAAAGQAQLT
jgi:IclR family pca regulon transcriptional regulator